MRPAWSALSRDAKSRFADARRSASRYIGVVCRRRGDGVFIEHGPPCTRALTKARDFIDTSSRVAKSPSWSGIAHW
jgi:hypothetical protein